MTKLPWPIQKTRGAGAPPIIDYVIEAEFDIDTGSTVRYQYPNDVPDYKPDWFAEHMLPEGAHNRVLDYTYIFLNRGGQHVDTCNWIKPDLDGSFTSSALSPVPPDESSTKPFLYGLNLVKTRHDATVRRGAIVKAMCIFSRYSFIEAFKKPLEIALDLFFDAPSIDVLKNLFDEVNSIDTSSLPWPNMLEQQLMRRGVHYDTIRPAMPDHLPRSWQYFLECPSRQGILSLPYPLYHTPDEIGDINVTRLVKLFGDSTMKIYHGILTKQRILFVGYGHAAHDIAQLVLSAVAMCAPPMSNLIRRTFPYANLTDLTFLEVKGYIAGVTNPMFQQRESWWDVLCILDLPNQTGSVVTKTEEKETKRSDMSGASTPVPSSSSGISSSGSPAYPAAATGGSSGSGNGSGMHTSVSAATLAAATDTGDGVPVVRTSSMSETTNNNNNVNAAQQAVDQRFISGVLSGIQASVGGEEWVRQQFFDYTTNLLLFIQDKNMLLHMSRLEERIRRFAEGNLPRMQILETTSEFKELPKHPWVWDSVKPEKNNTTVGLSLSTDNSPTKDALDSTEVTNNPEFPLLATSLMAHDKQISPVYASACTQFTPVSLKNKLLRLRLDHSIAFTRDMEVHLLMAEHYLLSETAIQGLVLLFPESQGGLTPLATGMFHASPIIRYVTMSLLTRIHRYPSTAAAWETMNTFLHAAYKRLLQPTKRAALLEEVLLMKLTSEDEKKPLSSSIAGGMLPSSVETMVTDIGNALMSTVDAMNFQADDDNEEEQEEDGEEGRNGVNVQRSGKPPLPPVKNENASVEDVLISTLGLM